MKKIYNYAFRIVCVYVATLTLFSLSQIEITISKNGSTVLSGNIIKELSTKQITQKVEKNTCEVAGEILNSNITEEQLDPQEESQKETSSQENIVVEKEAPVEETKKETEPSTPTYTMTETIDTTNFPVISVNTGTVSHYGHDCYGCTSGYTASGYYIGDGRTYYTDPVYGSVRVVASGKEYPLGTIMRLTNVDANPILAIVLDRGGDIGSGRKYILDLLTESNAKAYQLGTRQNVQIEVLRLGY